MAVLAITLTESTRGLTSVIAPRSGIAYQGHSFAPSVRMYTEPSIGRDGANDTTSKLDAAAFSLNVAYPAGDRSLIDELGKLLHPALRPVIRFSDSGWPAGDRQLTLRYDSGCPPVELGRGLQRFAQYQWVVPNGKWEAADLSTSTVNAFIPATTGLTWDVTVGATWTSAGILWPATTQAAAVVAANPGGLDVDWTCRIYGPCTGPKIANDLAPNAQSITGLGLALEWDDSLDLVAGEYIDIDSATATALRNSDPSNPVDAQLNFATSDWWLMMAGGNQLRYYPTAAGPQSVAAFSYRPAWVLG